MANLPRDFTSIVLSAVKGKDYDIRIREVGASVAVVALHGGGIEPLTGELAHAIAGEEYNLYLFEGLRPSNNEALRISPLRFREMRFEALLHRSKTVLSIAGVGDIGMTVQVGGTNKFLRALLLEAFTQAGFDGRPSETPGIDEAPAYFFNRAEEGGVQLELSAALRGSFINGPLHAFRWQDPTCWNERFYLFVDTVRGALAHYVAASRGDLAKALERFERTTRLMPPWMRRGHSE